MELHNFEAAKKMGGARPLPGSANGTANDSAPTPAIGRSAGAILWVNDRRPGMTGDSVPNRSPTCQESRCAWWCCRVAIGMVFWSRYERS